LNFHSTILPKLWYPLAATTFTESQCSQILAPALSIGLATSGIVRTLPRDLVHGSVHYQGLGIPSLYSEQGLAHTDVLLRFGNRPDTITGGLLRISVEQLTLEIGLPDPPLQSNIANFSWLTPTWLTHTGQFLSSSGLQLRTDLPTLPIYREDDQYLMVAFLRAGITGLRFLHYCRMYLRVTCLSELVSGDGCSITDKSWLGIRDDKRPHYWNYPNQARPNEKTWDLWRSALTATFQLEGQTLPQRHSSARIYYELVNHDRRDSHRRFTSIDLPLRSLPSDMSRAVVRRVHNYLQYDGTSEMVVFHPATPTVHSLTQFQQKLGCEYEWIFSRGQYTDDGWEVAESLQYGGCMAISDGSYKDGLGMASLVILGKTKRCRVRADVVSPGGPNGQNTFRSELAGLYATVIWVTSIAEYYGVSGGTIEFGCDCSSALWQCFIRLAPHKPTTPHNDLIQAIIHAIKESPVEWQQRYVKGHADREGRELTEWERLNCEMDACAKQYWEEVRQAKPPISYVVPGEPWSAWLHGRKIHVNLRQELLQAISTQRITSYYLQSGRFNEQTIAMVDWAAVGSAAKALPLTRRLWMVKHVSGYCGVGVNLVKWKQHSSDLCPRCGSPGKTSENIARCPQLEAGQVWTQSLQRLRDRLQDLQTAPALVELVLAYLLSWKEDIGSPTPPVPDHLYQLVEAQSTIGWQRFLEGSISVKWQEHQARYYTAIGSKLSVRRWTTALIHKLWDVSWDQWEHRNDAVHQAAGAIRRSADIRARIEQEWVTGGRELLPHHQHLFDGTMDGLLSNNVSFQRAWLESVWGARCLYASRDHHAVECQRAMMYRFFGQPQQPPRQLVPRESGPRRGGRGRRRPQ
jgi:hypothetical protein